MENKKGPYLLSLISILIILFIILQAYWILRDYQYYSSQPLFSTGIDFYKQEPKQLVNAGTLSFEKSKIVAVVPAEKIIPGRSFTIRPAKGNPSATAQTIVLANVSNNNSIALQHLPTVTTPVNYIKNKALWQFSYSLILLLAISGWLVYMLFFIFRQRRFAALKNEFVDNMAHELLTPITNISLAVEGIADYGIMQNLSKRSIYLNVCKNEANHLSLLVERILQQSMFNTGTMVLEKQKTEVNALIDKLLSLYLINEHIKIDFDKQYAEMWVNLDPIHTTNIIKNLIDNALKYSVDKQIIVLVSRFDKKSWILSIKDHGIGIEKKYQKLIFKKFYRIKHPTVKKKGFGLGLNYVKQVAELHGGKIILDSTPTGSTFSIFIPI